MGASGVLRRGEWRGITRLPPPPLPAHHHPRAPIHTRTRSYGFFTAVNASHATWSFKTIKADGPGPADFSDTLTIVQASHGPRA